MADTYSARWQQMRDQHAYERRIEARGIDATIEPYIASSPIPTQRRSAGAYGGATNRTA